MNIQPRPPTEDDETSNIIPAPAVDTELRWNWNTPFILSPHNPRVVFAGGNRLYKSLDQGNSWTMSPDLTKNIDTDEVQIMGSTSPCRAVDSSIAVKSASCPRNDGVRNYSTLVTIAESTIMPGLLWVGGGRRQRSGQSRRRRDLDRGRTKRTGWDDDLLRVTCGGLPLRSRDGLHLLGRP